MLLNIWRKFSFGALYFAVAFVVRRILMTVFSITGLSMASLFIYLNLWFIYDFIGYAVVIALSFKFRFKRGDLRKKYLADTIYANTVRLEILHVIPFNEFLTELVMAFVYFAVRYLVLSSNGIYFVVNMLFFVIADAAVWIAVHNKWSEEGAAEVG